MDTFYKATISQEERQAVYDALVRSHGARTAAGALAAAMEGETFLNSTYQVNRRKVETPIGDMWHLSIKRIDRGVMRDWRELQEIKNALCGAECEGVELFPAESRLVDTANQYHLWVFVDTEAAFPFGFFERLVSSDPGVILPDFPKAVQRPR